MPNALQSHETGTISNSTATIADSPEELERFLNARHLDLETAQRYGIAALNGSIVIPYLREGEIKNRKYRAVNEKKFWQDGGKQFVWNHDCLLDDTLKDEPLIITEGEFDALAAIQCGYVKTISVPNGGTDGEANLNWLFDIEDKIGCDVILCFDGDDVGANLLEQTSNAIGKARCKWVKYPKGCKDLNDALVKYGEKGITETIKRADWVSVKGHYRMSSLAPIPYRQAMTAGMGKIDDHMRIRLGDFSVLTGIPGHGKTTFLNDFINRILDKYDLTACFASFENPPQTDHKRALRTWHSGKLEKYMSEAEKAAADEWIDKRYLFIVPGEGDDVTLEWVMERMEVVVLRHGVKILVIDPWNEMDHIRPQGMTMTEYVGNAIRHLKSFAKSRGVHVMVVAHPAKMQRNKDGKYPVPSLMDISDSQHWTNKADLGIVVHRCPDDGDTVRTVKSRYHTEIGTPGIVDVKFSHDTGRFSVVDNGVLFQGGIK